MKAMKHLRNSITELLEKETDVFEIYTALSFVTGEFIRLLSNHQMGDANILIERNTIMVTHAQTCSKLCNHESLELKQ